MVLARIDYLVRLRKFRVDYLKFDYSKIRAFGGMSSIQNADVNLRMPCFGGACGRRFFGMWLFFSNSLFFQKQI